MNTFPPDPLNTPYQSYLSAWQAAQKQPDAAALQAVLDEQSLALWTAVYPVLIRLAKAVLKGVFSGRDFHSAEELASALSEYLFRAHPHLRINTETFDFTNGSITAYLTKLVKNAYIDDVRRLKGRDKGMGRVYLALDELGGAVDLPSDRRTQSGYFALKQTRHHLTIYLRQIPGSIVKIPTGGKTPGVRTARLTKGHALLLHLWMAGEDSLSWDELAHTMQRPVGTVKRWFIEVKRHLLTDTSPDALALRSLYGVSQLAKADEPVEVEESAQER